MRAAIAIHSDAKAMQIELTGFSPFTARGFFLSDAPNSDASIHFPAFTLVVVSSDKIAADQHPDLFRCFLRDQNAVADGHIRPIGEAGSTTSLSSALRGFWLDWYVLFKRLHPCHNVALQCITKTYLSRQTNSCKNGDHFSLKKPIISCVCQVQQFGHGTGDAGGELLCQSRP